MNSLRIETVFLLSLLLTAASVGAQNPEKDWAPMMFPDRGPWGLVIHTAFRGKAMKSLGVQWARITCRWRTTEKADGTYDFDHCIRQADHFRKYGIRSMVILTLEKPNPHYKDRIKDHEYILSAIDRWARAAATALRGRGVLYEINNEPEIGTMAGYWKDPVLYTTMARRVAKIVKKVDPGAHIGALSVAWFDRNYIQAALEAGLLADGTIDVLTYHGYHRRGMMPESGLAEDVAWLRRMVRKYAKPGHDVIVVDSERGYSINPFLEPKSWSGWRNRTYCETEQAAYLARHYLESIHLGLEIIVWYKDMQGEANFSLYYRKDDSPEGLRPMGHVYRNLAHLLPENPKKLANDLYPVSLVDLPDKISAPDSTLQVRTYLRKHEKKHRLIIAAWNQVEAFEGKILESRKRIGDDYYEAWRAISPDDNVKIPVRFEITGLMGKSVKSMQPCDVLAKSRAKFYQPGVKFDKKSTSVLSPVMNVGPIPTVVVVNILPDAKP